MWTPIPLFGLPHSNARRDLSKAQECCSDFVPLKTPPRPITRALSQPNPVASNPTTPPSTQTLWTAISSWSPVFRSHHLQPLYFRVIRGSTFPSLLRIRRSIEIVDNRSPLASSSGNSPCPIGVIASFMLWAALIKFTGELLHRSYIPGEFGPAAVCN